MNLPMIDFIVIGFIIISILIGIYRGLVKEILSVASWVLAAFISFRYAEMISTYIARYVSQPDLALAIAYVLVFIVALLVFSVISHIIGQTFSSTGISGFDRILGSIFGALRGALIVAILIMVGRFMALDQQQWWVDSQLLSYFEPLVEWIKTFLPAEVLNKIDA